MSTETETETETDEQRIARLEAELTRALRKASTAETALERMKDNEAAGTAYRDQIRRALGYHHNVSFDVVVEDLRHAQRSWAQHREWIDPRGWRVYRNAANTVVGEIPVWPHDEDEDIDYRAQRFFETRDPSMGYLHWRQSTWTFRETMRDRHGRAVDVGAMLEHPIDGRLVVAGFSGTYGVECGQGGLLREGVAESAKIGTDATLEAAYYQQWRDAPPVTGAPPKAGAADTIEPPAEVRCGRCGRCGQPKQH